MPDKRQCAKRCVQCWRNKLKHGCPAAKREYEMEGAAEPTLAAPPRKAKRSEKFVDLCVPMGRYDRLSTIEAKVSEETGSCASGLLMFAGKPLLRDALLTKLKLEPGSVLTFDNYTRKQILRYTITL